LQEQILTISAHGTIISMAYLAPIHSKFVNYERYFGIGISKLSLTQIESIALNCKNRYWRFQRMERLSQWP